jgi:hypothetical protein
MANETFYDPLEEVMNRQAAIINPEAAKSVEPVDVLHPADEDEYGMNDQQREIAEEDAIREAARLAHQEELAAAAEANQNLTQMPPRSLDPEFQKESIEYQGSVLEIVGRMIDKVIAKHNLGKGGIPESTDSDPNFKHHLMGELIEQYHLRGEEITPAFESLIVANWQRDYSEDVPEETNAETEELKPNLAETAVEPVAREIIPEININVESGQDVTVNINEDVVNEMSTAQKVNIRVIETTVEDMRSATVIENSQRDDIITPYESGMYNAPLSLPLSGYRCVITPLSFFEYVQMTSTPPSGSQLDQDKRVWSIIYKHIKNVSIGEFKSFEDFLKKTKYADQQLLQWGILITSAEDVETATIQCGNPKCRKPHEIKYRPRDIIHINDELAEECDFKTTGSVAPGPAAIAHYNKINSTVKMYELPDTKYLVEIDSTASAYDFLNVRYPLMEELRKRFHPDDEDGQLIDDKYNSDEEYNFLLGHAMFIKAISKTVDGKTYRYTNWDDIEKIITTSLSVHDSGALMRLINDVGMKTYNPVQFYIEDVTCDKCGRHDDRIMIPDIAQSLLFQLSQRLSSMEISLTEMEQN